jgi:hypothetical protein
MKRNPSITWPDGVVKHLGCLAVDGSTAQQLSTFMTGD